MTRTVQFIEPSEGVTDSLLTDFRWAAESAVGDALIITYSFVSSIDDLYVDELYGYDSAQADWDFPFRSAFRAFDNAERTATEAILRDYENIINVSFVEIDNASDALLRFSITDLDPDGSAGLAFSPSSKFVPFTVVSGEIHEASELAGDIWIDDDLSSTVFNETLIHEIGHALGLSHPHESGFEFVEEIFNTTLDGELDYTRYTVMSYEVKPASIAERDVDFWSVASTPMSLDIDALQHLYGAAQNNTNDLYIINPFLDDHLDPSSLGYDGYQVHDYTNSYISIVDNGGSNVLLVPGDADLRIDLNGGSWSYTQGGFLAGNIDDDNLYISPETEIQTLETGAGNDVITGNSLDNTIDAGAGDDVYYYVDGADTVNGGDGSDIIEFPTANFSRYKFVRDETGGLTASETLGDDVISLNSVETLVFGEHTLQVATLSADISATSRNLILEDDGPLYLSDIGTASKVVESVDAQLYRMYFGSLGRIPDAGGFDFWQQQVERGVYTFSEVAARFIDSPEFKGLADVNGLNGVDDFEFLNHMYKNVFGRAADQNGYVWWLSKLDDDTHSQATAFASMVQSDEFVLTTAATVADYLFV